jgi:peroxiredoxin Q/BCP
VQIITETMARISTRHARPALSSGAAAGTQAGGGVRGPAPARGRASEERSPKAIEEGKKAPAFTLTDAAGKKVSLADFAGKHVILYFYPKDDTPGCTKEACGFRDDWKTLTKADAVVLGVSADDGASHQRFAEKYKLPFPLLSDPDRKVMKEYGAYGEKMMYGKKTTGVIRSTVWIPRRQVRKLGKGSTRPTSAKVLRRCARTAERRG